MRKYQSIVRPHTGYQRRAQSGDRKRKKWPFKGQEKMVDSR
jgi:hypothetical protein